MVDLVPVCVILSEKRARLAEHLGRALSVIIGMQVQAKFIEILPRLYDHQCPRIRPLVRLQCNSRERGTHTRVQMQAQLHAALTPNAHSAIRQHLWTATLDWTSASCCCVQTTVPVESPPSISETWISSPNSGSGSLPLECRHRKHRFPMLLSFNLPQ